LENGWPFFGPLWKSLALFWTRFGPLAKSRSGNPVVEDTCERYKITRQCHFLFSVVFFFRKPDVNHSQTSIRLSATMSFSLAVIVY